MNIRGLVTGECQPKHDGLTVELPLAERRCNFVTGPDQAFRIGHRDDPVPFVIAKQDHHGFDGMVRAALCQVITAVPVNLHLLVILCGHRRLHCDQRIARSTEEVHSKAIVGDDSESPTQKHEYSNYPNF